MSQKTSSKRKNTKIATVREIFHSHLPQVGKVDRKVFRRTVLDKIMSETGSSKNSAGVMYDTIKREAEQEGLLARGVIGHRPNTLDKLDPSFSWTVVRKEDGVPQAQAISRRKAEAAATKDDKVVKTSDLIGEESESEESETSESNNETSQEETSTEGDDDNTTSEEDSSNETSVTEAETQEPATA